METADSLEVDKSEADKVPPTTCGRSGKRSYQFDDIIDNFFDKLHHSTARQAVLILLVIVYAVVTGLLYGETTERAQFFFILSVTLLMILVSLMTFVAYCRQDDNLALTALLTITLVYSAMFSTLSSYGLPDATLSCKLIAISLSPAYLIICLQQEEKYHAVFATAIVFPSLLTSSLNDSMNLANRCTLFLPAVVFFQYKETDFASRFWTRKAIYDFLAKPLIPISGVAIIIGVTIESIALSLHSQFWKVAGFGIFLFGLCLFHYYLQVLRLVEDDENTSSQPSRVSKKRIWGIILIVVVMFIDLGAISTVSLGKTPINVAPLCSFLFCCLLALDYLYRPIRGPIRHIMHSVLNFELCLIFLLCVYCSTPVLKTCDKLHDCPSLPPNSEKKPVDQMFVMAYMLYISLFYYCSMTTLIQSDGRANEAEDILPVTTKDGQESNMEISVVSEKVPVYNANDKEFEVPKKAALYLPD